MYIYILYLENTSRKTIFCWVKIHLCWVILYLENHLFHWPSINWLGLGRPGKVPAQLVAEPRRMSQMVGLCWVNGKKCLCDILNMYFWFTYILYMYFFADFSWVTTNKAGSRYLLRPSKSLRDIEKTSKKHPKNIQKTSKRHPKTSKRHPKDIKKNIQKTFKKNIQKTDIQKMETGAPTKSNCEFWWFLDPKEGFPYKIHLSLG